MGNRSERRSDRLFSNSTKVSFVIGFALIWLFLSMAFEPESTEQAHGSGVSENGSVPEAGENLARSNAGSVTTGPAALTEPTRKRIEDLFGQIEKEPDHKAQLLRQLRRVLHEAFAGQEDCWSCEGSVYFDKFDQIAGRGEARKPFGFREWLDEGDDAYQNQNLNAARKYYSQALQVMDERSLQDVDTIESEAVERLRSRCQELRCR